MIVGVAISGQCALPAAAQTPTPTAAGVVSVDVGSATGKPGEQITVEVTLHTAGFAVAGVQNDISFLPVIVSLVGCAVNPAIGKDLTQFGLSFAGLRAIILGDNVDPIPDGALLYTCTFTVPPGALPGDWPLTISRVVASSPFGEALPAQGSNGIVVIPGARPTRTPTATPTPIVPAIVLDSVRAVPGERIPMRAWLVSGGAVVAGTQNSLLFDGTNVRVAANADGAPDCQVNPNIDKTASAFAFQPPGCAGATCTGVMAIVLSFSNTQAIADRVTLYTCMVDVSAEAPSLFEYPLGIGGVMMSDPSGQRVPGTIGIGGSIFVDAPVATPTPAQPSIIIDPVRGQAGDAVLLQARLVTTGESLAGTQNDIAFDGSSISIAARPNGKPDCHVNADIDKEATSFAFLPNGCSGSACTAVRAIVFATDNVAPIADGAVLYTCTVHISAAAPSGVYPLLISGIVLSTPDGRQVSATSTGTSAVLVGIVNDPHDPGGFAVPPVPAQPGISPVAASTAAPTIPPRTATASPRAATASDGGTTAAMSGGDGCGIGDANRHPAGAVLFLPAAAAAIRKRRRRP